MIRLLSLSARAGCSRQQGEFYFDGSSKRPVSTRIEVYVDGVKDNVLNKRAITNP